ncbi:MAG TPA: YncE family protein [Mucilaginibacter sp.]|jgi:DNA-binding beta-propeller fold protein YncE|nr:YncE family protein [Mucilaginibacter sp.]
MNLIKRYAATLALFGLAASVPSTGWSQTSTGFKVLNDYKINSPGGWDYILVDGANKRVYVSHGTQVNVISTTGDSLGYIPKTTGVHGIALVHDLNKGFTSNGRANSVTVFDLKTLTRTNDIDLPVKNPDAIFYDDFSKKIITCDGGSHDLCFIDPATEKVVGTVQLGEKLETAVSDGKGKIFVNGEDNSTVHVVDATTLKEITSYKIDGGSSPSGLDIDRKTNRLFIGCGDSKTMVVMDASNGKTLGKFPIGRTDGLVFDPQLKIAYASNGEGTITAVREVNANKFELIENITTEPGARTIGIDLVTHHLYLPTAKFGTAPAATTDNPRPRAPMIPGSFHVIEVGK